MWNHKQIKVLTNRGTYTIHAVIMTKYQKDLPTTILKRANVLSKANKSPYGRLPTWGPEYNDCVALVQIQFIQSEHSFFF